MPVAHGRIVVRFVMLTASSWNTTTLVLDHGGNDSQLCAKAFAVGWRVAIFYFLQ